MGVSCRKTPTGFECDPFPKSNDPNIAVVTSVPIGQRNLGGQIQRRGGSSPGVIGKISNTPDFTIDNTIKKGSSFLPSQTPNRSLSSISLENTKQAKRDRFCKIEVKKGKRVRVCKVKTSKKKKKSKSKPIKSIFDLSF